MQSVDWTFTVTFELLSSTILPSRLNGSEYYQAATGKLSLKSDFFEDDWYTGKDTRSTRKYIPCKFRLNEVPHIKKKEGFVRMALCNTES